MAILCIHYYADKERTSNRIDIADIPHLTVLVHWYCKLYIEGRLIERLLVVVVVGCFQLDNPQAIVGFKI